MKFFYRVYRDFSISLRTFNNIKKPVVTFFGSGNTPENHPYYAATLELARALAQAGFGVLTGGGMGLMQAANQGAVEVKGSSYSCRIDLQKEMHSRPYLYDVDRMVETFWLRKLFLIRPAIAFIAVPGGFGTLDEIFEVLTLLRTAKLNNRKIIFFNTEYWAFIKQFIEKTMIEDAMIDKCDLDFIVWADSLPDVLRALNVS